MRCWLAVHDRLERDYRAPRVLGWVDLAGTPYGGLVFEHIEGETWDTAGRPSLFGELRDLLKRLHEDRQLAERLTDGPRGYRERREAPLPRAVRGGPEDRASPAGVRHRRARLSWMEEEARVVLDLPSGNGAFEGVTRSPCHWDLWPNNVLVGADGRPWGPGLGRPRRG